MTILSFSSSDDQLSIFAIADIMEEKGDLSYLVLYPMPSSSILIIMLYACTAL